MRIPRLPSALSLLIGLGAFGAAYWCFDNVILYWVPAGGPPVSVPSWAWLSAWALMPALLGVWWYEKSSLRTNGLPVIPVWALLAGFGTWAVAGFVWDEVGRLVMPDSFPSEDPRKAWFFVSALWVPGFPAAVSSYFTRGMGAFWAVAWIFIDLVKAGAELAWVVRDHPSGPEQGVASQVIRLLLEDRIVSIASLVQLAIVGMVSLMAGHLGRLRMEVRFRGRLLLIGLSLIAAGRLYEALMRNGSHLWDLLAGVRDQVGYLNTVILAVGVFFVGISGRISGQGKWKIISALGLWWGSWLIVGGNVLAILVHGVNLPLGGAFVLIMGGSLILLVSESRKLVRQTEGAVRAA